MAVFDLITSDNVLQNQTQIRAEPISARHSTRSGLLPLFVHGARAAAWVEEYFGAIFSAHGYRATR